MSQDESLSKHLLGECCGVRWTDVPQLVTQGVRLATISQEGPHRVARCSTCEKWLRALPGPAHDYVIQFGKYKGAIVADLWAQDAPYCEWLLTIAKPRLTQVLTETRP